jgi:putative acetyltransferase
MSRADDEYLIRPATNDDGAAVREIVFSVLEEYGLEPAIETTDADLVDIEASYVRAGGAFEVVERRDGRIVGSVGLMPLDRRRVELRKMYLAPSARGRGLGKRLLRRMLDRARALGFDEVRLETHSVLQEAIRLYEAHGFVPVEAEHRSPRCDQTYRLRL